MKKITAVGLCLASVLANAQVALSVNELEDAGDFGRRERWILKTLYTYNDGQTSYTESRFRHQNVCVFEAKESWKAYWYYENPHRVTVNMRCVNNKSGNTVIVTCDSEMNCNV